MRGITNAKEAYFAEQNQETGARGRQAAIDPEDHEDRRLPRRFEIGDVLDGHDGPLADQPGETGGVNAAAARGVVSQPTRIFEPVE